MHRERLILFQTQTKNTRPVSFGRRFVRGSSVCLGLLVMSALWLGTAQAYGFHDGGVGRCAGCHVMHGELQGQVVIIGDEALLAASSPTDLCLTCHAGQNGVFGTSPLNPPPERGAGNFVFLLEDNINDSPDGQTNPIGGHAAGHSVVSLAQGVSVDPQWPYSPGGSFPTSELSCVSCHDPHGNSSFRMLNGAGPVQGGIFDFIYPAPEATGIDPTDPFSMETNSNHTAYRSGMGNWCANCHGQYHDNATGGRLRHEFDAELEGTELDNYNQYNGTGDPQGGNVATAYLAAVPIEDPASTVDRESGAVTGSTTMCLSCHRAHASSAPHALRWDRYVGQLSLDGVVSGSYPIPNPYPDANQVSLCAKCHRGPRDGAGGLPTIQP